MDSVFNDTVNIVEIDEGFDTIIMLVAPCCYNPATGARGSVVLQHRVS